MENNNENGFELDQIDLFELIGDLRTKMQELLENGELDGMDEDDVEETFRILKPRNMKELLEQGISAEWMEPFNVWILDGGRGTRLKVSVPEPQPESDLAL